MDNLNDDEQQFFFDSAVKKLAAGKQVSELDAIEIDALDHAIFWYRYNASAPSIDKNKPF